MAKKSAHIGGHQLPLFKPDSDWRPPAELPDLRRPGVVIAIDTEGKDAGLSAKKSSSWPKKSGFISGLAVAWEGGAFYAPTRHEDSPENMPEENVIRWLDDHKRAGAKFVTHHGSHDWGWISNTWGVEVPEGDQIDDTEGMAAVVDENRLSYSLDDLCRWRGISGKDESKLKEAAVAYLSIQPSEVKGYMTELPARYVGPYAEQDARATLALRNDLWEEVQAQNLVEAYQLEMDLLPMVLKMRRRGIRVNLPAAEEALISLGAERDRILAELADKMGMPTGLMTIERCRSPGELAKLFAQHAPEIKIQYTGKTHQPSFEASWMRKHVHWLPRLVARAEQLEDAADKFIHGFIIEPSDSNGRIYASINQYRGEEGGTRSHRFSYSDPPLQQMPARDGELAALIRGLFLPELGEVWGACDYSQQEYRLIVHFADLLGCTGASIAAQQYIDDPATDFHVLVSELTGLERKPAKDTNFAKAFGAGVPKFAAMIGKSIEEAEAIYKQYDREMPFVKELARKCQQVAENRGYIRLLDGARSHFEMFEPAWRERDEAYAGPRPLASARELWPEPRRLKRAWGHKAMNRLIQGSAARQTKMAMRACYREGLIPMIQMHDELGFSLSSIGQGQRCQQLMREVVQLRVPMKVDAELGATWGDATRKIEAVTDFNELRCAA